MSLILKIYKNNGPVEVGCRSKAITQRGLGLGPGVMFSLVIANVQQCPHGIGQRFGA